MRTFEVLVLDEDDMTDSGNVKQSVGGDRIMWKATHVVLNKKDGTAEVLKDRWGYSDHPGNVVLAFTSQ